MERNAASSQKNNAPAHSVFASGDAVDEKSSRFDDPRGRAILAVKARWLFVSLVGVYGLCAGGIYSVSDYGFFLSPLQIEILVFSAAGIIFYNSFFLWLFGKTDKIQEIILMQVFLDLLFVTILVHFSGGANSWLWAIYLIVTLEAAVLIEKKEWVWGMGILGASLYGALLWAEFIGLLSGVEMPFVDSSLHYDPLYLGLMWCWVTLLNAAMALIGAFLMNIIRRENQAVRNSEDRLVSFLGNANDLIFSFDAEGRFLYTNHAWQQTLAYDTAVDENLSLSDILHEEDRARCLADISTVQNQGISRFVEGRFVARDGTVIIVEGNVTCSDTDGKNKITWGICRDITARKKAQEQLYHMAHHDMLTSLPNRLFFLDRLQQACAMARRQKKQVGVLFLDLDRFKVINDTLGHAIGDILLQEMADRLLTCVREVDTVARLGGDEFTVVLSGINGPDDAERVADKLLHKLAKPFRVEEHELFITTSIGISLYPKHDEDPAGLIKMADIAMYSAKAHGRNNYQFYEPAMELDADRRLILTNGLRRALEREEFCLHYQPKVDIGSGKVTSMEALVRWDHPELGLVAPGDFIPVAEETGIIIPLGEWVIRTACEQNRLWQHMGLPEVRVAVNLSGYQLQHRDFVASVQRILDQTGFDGKFLEFEITETVVMQNPDFAVGILNQLRDFGAHISIDDFGTGYSSLAHLKRFSVNTLKIDKSFVKDVHNNSTDAAIATAIISMGNSLDLKVIAEGVENDGQLDFLKSNQCDEMQGFLFSKPVPAEEAVKFLEAERDRGSKEAEKAKAASGNTEAAFVDFYACSSGAGFRPRALPTSSSQMLTAPLRTVRPMLMASTISWSVAPAPWAFWA